MHHLIRTLAVAVLIGGTALPALAAVLRGKVTDADAEGEPLIQASVRILNQSDSALVKGAVTNENGNFTINNLRAGKYIVEASYVGYTTQTRNITVGTEDIHLRTFSMSQSAVALHEATVVGTRTPIKVMEDTIEYAAESYKTAPNAVVEDLLKRLPGVEVGSDGKITANGKSVSKILVDGKEFFSDDPTVASRNLPVDMVEKLQVVDRKSDLARMTGVDDGEEETVINLTVKKDRKQGWFGNVEAGYGTDDRYKVNVNINRFVGGNQFTLIGSANNINEPGFADMAAGRFRRFGGATGINSTQSVGVNFNVGNEEIFRIGGDVFYSHSSMDSRTETERQYLFNDSTSTTRSNKTSDDRSHSVSSNFRIQWKPDSLNTFEFRPTFSATWSDNNSNELSETFAGDRNNSQVTRSINTDRNDGKSINASGHIIFNHNFRSKPGRSFSLFARYNFSDTKEENNSYSLNKFFLLGDSVDLYDQYVDNHTWSNNVSARVSWTEPIGDAKKGHFLTLAYRFSYRWNDADRLTYDHPVSFPDGWEGDPVISNELVFNSELSNRFRNNFMDQDIRLGYRRVTQKGNFNVGISLVPSMSKSINLINSEKNIPIRHVLNVAPFLRYRYKFSKASNIGLDYNGRSSQPSLTQLQPVADKSDPLRIVIGNPELKPTFSHNARIRFQDFNQEAQRSIMLMSDISMEQNSIISRTDFNSETGGQTTTYENVNGIWSARLMNMVSFPLRNKAWSINNHVFFNYASGVGYNNGQKNRSNSYMVNESFGIAFRPDYLEFEFRPRYSFQHVNNSVSSANSSDVHTYGGSFYAAYNAPFGLILNSDLNYSATSGYAAGYDTKTWMWNATIGYQFLKGRNATISLKAYDILGQRSNIRRNITANYIDDSRYNSLTRYVMVTFSYRFNTFSKGKGGDVDMDMPGGGFRGGRGSMGPPPGR